MNTFPPLRLLPPLPVAVDFVAGLGPVPAELDAQARAYFLAAGPALVASGKLLPVDLHLFAGFCQYRAEVDRVSAEIAALKNAKSTARARRWLQRRKAHKRRSAALLRAFAESLSIDLTTSKK